MKKVNKNLFLATLSLVTTLSMSGVATAKTTHTKPFSAKVNYTCQQGKTVGVTYHFNNVGLPTSASAVLNGQTRVMPIDLDKSDNVGNSFGKENSYNLGSEYLTSKNYRRVSGINIFSPSSEILFKECNPH